MTKTNSKQASLLGETDQRTDYKKKKMIRKEHSSLLSAIPLFQTKHPQSKIKRRIDKTEKWSPEREKLHKLGLRVINLQTARQ